MEVAVHPAGGGPVRRGRAAVGVPFEQGAPLHEPVDREFVEGVARGAPAVLSACGVQQVVDQREGVGGVRAAMAEGPAGRRTRAVARGHHLFQAGVHGAEERPGAGDCARVSSAPTRWSPSTQGCRA